MKLTPATSLAAVAVIGVTGFAIGRISSPSESSEAPAALAEERGVRNRFAPRGEAPAGRSTRPGRENVRAETRTNLTSEEKRARLEEIVRSENALDRSRALLAFVDQLGPGEFEDAVAHFRSLGITESRFGEYSMLLTAWAETDPTEALAYASENTGGNFASNTILTAWAGRDAEAAIAWAEQTHTGEGANPHMAGIIRGIAGADPVRATQLLTGLPFSRERGDALAAMLPHVVEQGPDAARLWVAGITDERLRDGAMMRLADQLAAVDPQGTAEWLVANPGQATDRRLGAVVDTWARQDPAAALGYFNSLPAGATRSNTLRGIVSATAADDPQAAAALLNRYAGDVDDGVVQNFVWRSFGSDPALAASRISMIADQGQRDNIYRRTLTTWLRRDPATAESWIRSANLPGPVIEHVNRQLTEMRRNQ